MFRDTTFVSTMNRLEKKAWISFKAVAQNFLGNTKRPEYKKIVSKMITEFRTLVCLMNLKLHFLHSHLDEFPDNLEDFGKEQSVRFHQDVKIMETRYQRRWDENMMADMVESANETHCTDHSIKREPGIVQRKENDLNFVYLSFVIHTYNF